tara:strand:+ start:4611 stop:6545 length:1935 start_codon:yes stop_codon:yes gene_type:complete
MHKVQLVQLNNKYGNQVYLPYSVGILQSHASQDKRIFENFKFNEFIFVRENVREMVKRIGTVNILGISCYVWNWKISLALAEEYKKAYPDSLILLGGPQVPDTPGNFFEKFPFVDLLCHGEGEDTFHEILSRYTHNEDLKTIASCSYNDRENSETIINQKRDRIQDLNIIASPYLSGIFDDIMNKYDYTWMATWETNRGCPFKCTFCDWGSLTASKVKKFEEKRLYDEIDHFSDRKIDLVFGADANFGMLRRDKDFSIRLVEKKMQTGYPNQFRVCFTKNTTNKVFELAKIFAKAGMNKGISVSMQSLNQDTLVDIKRDNIKLSFFKDLQQKYVEAGLVTYTELILPLPGETHESFVNGIDNLLDSSQHSGIVVYNCTIMPNAEMGDPKYQKTHGLDMVEIPIFQAHSDAKEDDIIENEIIVVGTNTMKRDEWIKTFKYSWTIQSMHMLGLLQAVAIFFRYQFGIEYSEFYQKLINYNAPRKTIISKELETIDNLLQGALKGKGLDQYVPEFENISWPSEEASFLRISNKIDTFYSEIKKFIEDEFPGLEDQKDMINELVDYQQFLIVKYNNSEEILETKFDFHNYFIQSRSGILSDIEEGSYTNKLAEAKDYKGDKKLFSREVVWYGRKGGKFFNPVDVRRNI